jgi:hypothetical protein
MVTLADKKQNATLNEKPPSALGSQMRFLPHRHTNGDHPKSKSTPQGTRKKFRKLRSTNQKLLLASCLFRRRLQWILQCPPLRKLRSRQLQLLVRLGRLKQLLSLELLQQLSLLLFLELLL